MSIKIIKDKEVVSFNMDEPIENQLVGSKQILVNYEKSDIVLEKFLDEIERLVTSGSHKDLNIKVTHHYNIAGMRVDKNLKDSQNALEINKLIKLMVSAYKKIDEKLESIAEICCRK